MSEIELLEKELQEIRMRHSLTTPGPWKSYIEGRDHQSGSDFIQTGGEDIELSGATREDQEFIAHAHQDIVRLLAEVERLKAPLQKD